MKDFLLGPSNQRLKEDELRASRVNLRFFLASTSEGRRTSTWESFLLEPKQLNEELLELQGLGILQQEGTARKDFLLELSVQRPKEDELRASRVNQRFLITTQLQQEGERQASREQVGKIQDQAGNNR